MTATGLHVLAVDLKDERMWIDLGMSALRIALILLAAWIAAKVLHKAIQRLLIDRSPERVRIQPRRVQTVGKLLNNTVSYCIYFVAFLLILGEFNISLAPLLAGAGIVGLAIGFGAQSLVRDVISGLFIILEDPFGVGDEVKIGSYKGKVEMIGLRTTRLRSWTGEVFIIPNGQINDVTNYSLHNALAVVDVTVDGGVSLERAMAVIGEAARQLKDDNVVREPEVLGVVTASADSATVRVVAECKPNTHEEVTRALNVLLRRALNELRTSPG
ncbi:MAG: mechanosensitive ion channel family protein [Thermobacillus sp.]|uniref:Small-conductance mechanosensitive channel n=1 Tax=Thermobacillus composti (strain DSM 18247 / JCM 13945 / KWC4) TaxID=717605 RepID=L0EKJ2_THECK|nr:MULTISPECIES: mechanosensitive ion channel family protein [Thermobacillus]AGA59790.1 small-conductance mechanosensitive channel [Thermobacillus composti KWC4]REK53505.1 MAG: mechanosensitive ion channel family protein [Thermobacillus sp.]